MTGLLGRRRLLELAEQDLARALPYARPLSLIAIDLDHFKQVNDRHGHASGDGVLAAVAGDQCEQPRQHDLVGRIGGEELAVVLLETGLATARQLAQRTRLQVSALAPIVDGVAIPVTVSLGVVEARTDDRSDPVAWKALTVPGTPAVTGPKEIAVICPDQDEAVRRPTRTHHLAADVRGRVRANV